MIIGLLRQTWAGLLVLLALTLILGIGYPAAVWTVSRIDSSTAEGSALVDADGCTVGSRLIGIDPQVPAGEPDPFFHTRVLGSAATQDPFTPGDPAASATSNLGPSSGTLADFVARRRTAIAERDGVDPAAVPADAVTGSGSGLDPQISPAYAAIQVPRVARVNGMPEDRVRQLVEEHTAPRTFGFLGAERVDVPELNLALGPRVQNPPTAPGAPECGG
jgi:K+-transporting ATPase ATPase C chain